MKASQNDFARIAPQAARKARIFLFCGPDEAAASDAARQIVTLLPEAGERVELAGGDLKKDPVLLGDEARSTSLFGATRHILARVAGEEAHDAVANLIAGEAEPCPVLIVATSLTDKSRTAKLLIDRPDALVAHFYPPRPEALAETIRKRANGMGLDFGDDIAQRIAHATSLDIRLAEAELAKLAVYLDAAPERPRRPSNADLDAIGAETEDDGFAPLVDAALGGRRPELADELRRLRMLELSPVGVLLAAERRASQLAQLAVKLGPRGNVRALVDQEKAAHRIFFRDADAIAQQLTIWKGQEAVWLANRVMALHRQIFANSGEGELLLSQGLAQIALKAAQLRKGQGSR